MKIIAGLEQPTQGEVVWSPGSVSYTHLPRAGEIIRQGLYRGADTGWLLTDRLFAGADTLATSYAPVSYTHLYASSCNQRTRITQFK